MAVAGEPLLLRAGPHRSVDPAIGHEPAARPTAIVERQVTAQVNAAVGCRLRHSPAIRTVGRAN
jgi:hypothetical protein